MKTQKTRIAVRVTQKEKDRITGYAKRCSLSTTEYVRQRALGYEPKPVPPDALFHFCEKLDALAEQPFSEEVNRAAQELLKDISAVLIAPGKEGTCGNGNHRLLARQRKAERGAGLRRESRQDHR